VHKIPKSIGSLFRCRCCLRHCYQSCQTICWCTRWKYCIFPVVYYFLSFLAIPSSSSYLFRSGLTFEDEIGFVALCSRVL